MGATAAFLMISATVLTLQMRQGGVRPPPCAIDLRFDTEDAELTLDLVDGTSRNPGLVAKVMATQGAEAILYKYRSLRGPAEARDLEAVLAGYSTGHPIEEDRFEVSRLRDGRVEARHLLDVLQDNEDQVAGVVCRRIRPFLPVGAPIKASVVLLGGGTATGFSRGDGAVYVALHRLKGDLETLELILVHELYHVMQETYETRRGPLMSVDGLDAATPTDAARFLLQSVYDEGTATFVMAPLDAPKRDTPIPFAMPASHGPALADRASMLEAFLYRVWHDPSANAAALYRIGFTGDAYLYQLGQYMAGRMVERRGPEILAGLMEQDPAAFFISYISITVDAPTETVRFSPAMEAIVRALAAGGNAGGGSETLEPGPR